MPESIATVRVKSTHPPSQGEWVILNAADFDPAIHQLYEDAAEEPKRRGRPPKQVKESSNGNG